MNLKNISCDFNTRKHLTLDILKIQKIIIFIFIFIFISKFYKCKFNIIINRNLKQMHFNINIDI
jgi:hypothetical protein